MIYCRKIARTLDRYLTGAREPDTLSMNYGVGVFSRDIALALSLVQLNFSLRIRVLLRTSLRLHISMLETKSEA